MFQWDQLTESISQLWKDLKKLSWYCINTGTVQDSGLRTIVTWDMDSDTQPDRYLDYSQQYSQTFMCEYFKYFGNVIDFVLWNMIFRLSLRVLTTLCICLVRLVCTGFMTSSNANIFRVTGHLCGEFTGHRWIPRTKASDTELWCFLWSASE